MEGPEQGMNRRDFLKLAGAAVAATALNAVPTAGETAEGNEDFKSLEVPSEYEEVLQGLEEGAGPEIARQERLAYLLADELGKVMNKKADDIRDLTYESFMTPEDSPLRRAWIAKLKDKQSAHRIVWLLNEIETLVMAP